MGTPRIEVVTKSTLPEFAAFLSDNLDRSRTPVQWESALRVNWDPARPNYGFVMRDDDRIVGGIGALYAVRHIAGRPEKFCNITSWCVLDRYRKHSMRLALALAGQTGYHYTDFSPTSVVGGVLRFLKFRPIDERQTVIANLPRPPGRNRVIAEPEEIAARLTGETLEVYRDHVAFPWLRHILAGNGDHWCYVIYKRRRYKGLPSAHVLYASDRALLSDCLPALSSHLFVRGMMTTHVETRHLVRDIQPSRVRSGFNAKLFLSPTLDASQIDSLYSESVAMDL